MGKHAKKNVERGVVYNLKENMVEQKGIPINQRETEQNQGPLTSRLWAEKKDGGYFKAISPGRKAYNSCTLSWARACYH